MNLKRILFLIYFIPLILVARENEKPNIVVIMADDFYNFGNLRWKKAHKERLEKMKTRWNELDSLYRVQGKVGLEVSN